MSLKPAVVIDGAIPRDAAERADVIFHYARALCIEQWEGDALHDKLIDLGRVAGKPLHVHEDYEVEDDLINFINEILPDGWVCTVGEPDPGDVIVREVGHMEDEIRAMGFA